MTGVSEGGVPILSGIAVRFALVSEMVAIASYVFTREVNKPF